MNIKHTHFASSSLNSFSSAVGSRWVNILNWDFGHERPIAYRENCIHTDLDSHHALVLIITRENLSISKGCVALTIKASIRAEIL